jgi:hypothetical protein
MACAIRQGHAPGRAAEKAHAELRLKSRDGAADRGRRPAEALGGAAEAADLSNGGEGCESSETIHVIVQEYATKIGFRKLFSFKRQ